MKSFVTLLLFFAFLNVKAQEQDTESVFMDIAGIKNISGQDVSKFVAMNYQFPREALDEGVSGTLRVEFTVEKDGTVQEAKIAQSLCESCDKEALRIVRKLRFHPIEIDGKPERVRFLLPINLSVQ